MNVYGEIACPRCSKRKWSAERQGSVGAQAERRCLWCGYSVAAMAFDARAAVAQTVFRAV